MPNPVTSPPTAVPDLRHPLALRRALRRGWRSFNRTAGRFVIVVLIAEVMVVLISEGIKEASRLLVQLASDPTNPGDVSSVAAACSLVAGFGLTLGIHWWMTVRLLRGAWMGLTGAQPRLADLLRWDGESLGRWSAMSLLILGILALGGGITGGLVGLMTLLAPPLAPVVQGLGLGMALVLLLSQLFCLPLVLVHRVSPLAALGLGVRGLIHHPVDWLLLGLIQILPQVLMLASHNLGGGLVLGIRLVSLPLSICILTAAYLDQGDATTALNGIQPDPETDWRDNNG